MINQQRPYLVLPKLILQPTWGGNYIAKMKGWQDNQLLTDKKIGQSYELFSQSKLLVFITDSTQEIIPELGLADSSKTINHTPYKHNVDHIALPQVSKLYKKAMLIKINQSLGNSFQIHIKPSQENNKWQAKPESWYYLENGYITFGINNKTDLNLYKSACYKIDQKMQELSQDVKNKVRSFDQAKKDAKIFVKQINPWQFVNSYNIAKDTFIDLSSGGIHHSWEDNLKEYPLGNVLYEVQRDVMDPVSTIRAFDQGKIADDGKIRKLNIKDYFKYLDITLEHNQLKINRPVLNNSRLAANPNYCLDRLIINNDLTDSTNGSFVHLFVRSGKIKVIANDGSVIVNQGHSCFIPEIVAKYLIKPLTKNVIMLKAFVIN